MVRPVSLIGAASGWGAGFRETESGPLILRDIGLAEWLRESGIAAHWGAMIEPALRWRAAAEQSREEIVRIVADHNKRLADATAGALVGGSLPVIIGGDHAIAMGSWSGVARALRQTEGPDAALGLIWFDAHLDSHTFDTSPSMNPHGMSAAMLLGHGAEAFRIGAAAPLQPEHLCFIGVRSYEPGELELLRRLGVRIFMAEEVASRGLAEVFAEALDIATKGTAGFGITIDLDGFEPSDAPGIGLKNPNGFRGADMIDALKGIAGHARLRAIEIVEYIPEFDEDWRTAHLIRDLLIAMLGQER